MITDTPPSQSSFRCNAATIVGFLDQLGVTDEFLAEVIEQTDVREIIELGGNNRSVVFVNHFIQILM
jgi:hypothetical protein